MAGNTILNLRYEPLSKWRTVVTKTAIDIISTGIFLNYHFPLIYFIVGNYYKIDFSGPIFFKYKKRNRFEWEWEFKCYKFRSMKVNEEADSKQAIVNDPKNLFWRFSSTF